jgi:hypothetical protein
LALRKNRKFLRINSLRLLARVASALLSQQ